MHDRTKFLLLRWILYCILTYLTFLPLFYIKNIDERMFFTTTSLLILPLCLEYYKGLSTFNPYALWGRRIGLVVFSFYVFMCFIALSGGISIVNDESTKTMSHISFYIGSNISIWFFKILIIFIPFFTFFDLIFTLSSEELKRYRVQDKINEMLKENTPSETREQAVKNKAEEMLSEFDMKGIGE